VLFVAPSLRRLLNMKKACETQAGAKKRFWFATAQDLNLSPGAILTAPIWFVASEDEPRVLWEGDHAQQ
jgi:hypothetical protein